MDSDKDKEQPAKERTPEAQARIQKAFKLLVQHRQRKEKEESERKESTGETEDQSE